MTKGFEHGRVPANLTLVDLTWRENRIEQRIRFGRIAAEQRIDDHRRIVGFNPGTIFAFVKWAANDYGMVVSRIDILRAVLPGESYQTIPLVNPGGEILLRVHRWPKVQKVLDAIDAIERRGIDPAEVAPDHWRHIHNRLVVNEPFRAYGGEQHRAWLRRRRILSGIGLGDAS